MVNRGEKSFQNGVAMALAKNGFFRGQSNEGKAYAVFVRNGEPTIEYNTGQWYKLSPNTQDIWLYRIYSGNNIIHQENIRSYNYPNGGDVYWTYIASGNMNLNVYFRSFTENGYGIVSNPWGDESLNRLDSVNIASIKTGIYGGSWYCGVPGDDRRFNPEYPQVYNNYTDADNDFSIDIIEDNVVYNMYISKFKSKPSVGDNYKEGIIAAVYDLNLDGSKSAPWYTSKYPALTKNVYINTSIETQTLTYWFYNFSQITKINGLTRIRFKQGSYQPYCAYTFKNCSNLLSVNLSKLNVKDFDNIFANEMFTNCSSLTTIYSPSLRPKTQQFQGTPFIGCTNIMVNGTKVYGNNYPTIGWHAAAGMGDVGGGYFEGVLKPHRGKWKLAKKGEIIDLYEWGDKDDRIKISLRINFDNGYYTVFFKDNKFSGVGVVYEKYMSDLSIDLIPTHLNNNSTSTPTHWELKGDILYSGRNAMAVFVYSTAQGDTPLIEDPYNGDRDFGLSDFYNETLAYGTVLEEEIIEEGPEEQQEEVDKQEPSSVPESEPEIVEEPEPETPEEPEPEKKVLKILGIGNSFTYFSLKYLWNILNDTGEYDEILVADNYWGGSSLNVQYKYRDTSSKYSDIGKYDGYWRYKRLKNGTFNAKRTTGQTLNEIIASNDWNYIIFQQQSTMSCVYETYHTSNFDIKDFVNWAKGYCPNAKIGIALTWTPSTSYSSDRLKSYYPNLKGGARDEAMYEDICATTAKLYKEGIFDFLVNLGGAMKRGRNNESLAALTPKGDLLRDSLHPAWGIPAYMMACVYAYTITGLGKNSFSWYPTESNLPSYFTPPETEVSDELAEIARNLAYKAVKNYKAYDLSNYTPNYTYTE